MTNHGLQIIELAKIRNKDQYQRMVGKLIYLSHTRRDIAYVVCVVSRFMHLSQVQYMTTVSRILRYLKRTKSRGILFNSNRRLNLVVYIDADWVGDWDNKKSTSGYCTLIGSNLVM